MLTTIPHKLIRPLQYTSYRHLSINCVQTPNPDARQYIVDVNILNPKTPPIHFTDKHSAGDSVLAMSVFKVFGVQSILLGLNYITVNKNPAISWEIMSPSIELVINQMFASQLPPVNPKLLVNESSTEKPTEGSHEEIVAEIKKILDDRVQPFVARDGGAVSFNRFEDGILWLNMHGACKGCPKSMITLKGGILRMMSYYIPSVEDVRNASEDDDLDEFGERMEAEYQEYDLTRDDNGNK